MLFDTSLQMVTFNVGWHHLLTRLLSGTRCFDRRPAKDSTQQGAQHSHCGRAIKPATGSAIVCTPWREGATEGTHRGEEVESERGCANMFL